MSIIQASCIDQTLTLTNTPVIASGGVGEDFVEFTFCPLWDGYIKTGVFYNNRGVFYSILDDTDTCVVPVQALQVPGNLFIAVFGTKNGVTRTSEVLQYQVVEGAVTTVPDPDPDVYAQICQEIAELRADWEGVKLDTPNKQGTASLVAASWVQDGDDYKQTVTIANTTTKSVIELRPSRAQWKAIRADGVASLTIENTDGVFTAWATDAAPSADYTLQATITEVV